MRTIGDAPDGLQQQMTLQTMAGHHYRIESSTDLETWISLVHVMGVQDGQEIAFSLATFEASGSGA